MAKIDLDQEDDWGEDMSPEAVAARQKELASDAVKKMTGSEDDPYADFGTYVESHREFISLLIVQLMHFHKRLRANLID
jgi:hypothetical protein